MRAAAALLLALALAPRAHAQSPPDHDDPIGALLDHRGDADEPDTAGQKVRPDADPSVQGLPPPTPYAPPSRPRLSTPAFIQETGKTADAPPSVRDMAYDGRIRASFAAAEGFQGPLEGGWTLAARRGGGLYSLQLVDRRDRLEGVWRDLRRPGALDASGLVEDIQRAGGELSLRFTAPGEVQTVVTLHDGGNGQWSGRLTRGDEVSDVALRRSVPGPTP